MSPKNLRENSVNVARALSSRSVIAASARTGIEGGELASSPNLAGYDPTCAVLTLPN